MFPFKTKFPKKINKEDLDKKLVFNLSKSRIPNLKQLKYLKDFLSAKEKKILNISFLIVFLGFVFLIYRFYFDHTKTSAAYGGKYIEGVVGSPSSINPLYEGLNDVDSDLNSLIYSSLFDRDSKGSLRKDLVESYSLSNDQKVYTIKIIKNAKFHNGDKLTADDVIFTFDNIKNPTYKSSLRNSFNGVEIEKVNDYTIKFTLQESYAPFLELLTFGVLPSSLWQQIPPEGSRLADLNLKPIGSGPYKFFSLVKSQDGFLKSYTLKANADYYRKKPFIDEVIFKFFASNEEALAALNNNQIDGLGYLTSSTQQKIIAVNSYNYYNLNFPQIFSIFFNLNEDAPFKNSKIRQALELAINKNEIVEKVLLNKARVIDSPVLPDNFACLKDSKSNCDANAALSLLNSQGWKLETITKETIENINKNEIEKNKEENKVKLALGVGNWLFKDKNPFFMRLTIADNDESNLIANMISDYWQKIGIKTEIEKIDEMVIQDQSIIPRKFSVLLYSIAMGSDPDPYPFWHSSQINQEGLNITGYSNKDVDRLLEEARVDNNVAKRKEKYIKFQQILKEDKPAIYLFSPFYSYIQDKKVKGFDMSSIIHPKDRFANIFNWYLKEDKQLAF